MVLPAGIVPGPEALLNSAATTLDRARRLVDTTHDPYHQSQMLFDGVNPDGVPCGFATVPGHEHIFCAASFRRMTGQLAGGEGV